MTVYVTTAEEIDNLICRGDEFSIEPRTYCLIMCHYGYVRRDAYHQADDMLTLTLYILKSNELSLFVTYIHTKNNKSVTYIYK